MRVFAQRDYYQTDKGDDLFFCLRYLMEIGFTKIREIFRLDSSALSIS